MKVKITRTRLAALLMTLALLGVFRRARCPEVSVGGGPPVSVGVQTDPPSNGSYRQKQKQTQKFYFGGAPATALPAVRVPGERRGLMDLYDWAEGKRPSSMAEERHKVREKELKLRKEELKLLKEVLGEEGVKEYLMGPRPQPAPAPVYAAPPAYPAYHPPAPPSYPPYPPAPPPYQPPPAYYYPPPAQPTYQAPYPPYSPQPLPRPACPLPPRPLAGE